MNCFTLSPCLHVKRSICKTVAKRLHDHEGALKMQDWKMQDWKMTDLNLPNLQYDGLAMRRQYEQQ